MFFAKSKGKRGEVYIYEEIGDGWFGGITAKAFAETLREIGDVTALDVYINSPGGSVFDGIAIYNQLKRFDGEVIVHIDGIAASIASVIAMAGKEIRIAANGMMMIHDPWSFAVGTADDMRKAADSLDKVRDTILDTYVARSGGKRDAISDLMSAETWLNADEAVKQGFATVKVEDEPVARAAVATVSNLLAKFKNTPPELRREASSAQSKIARVNVRAEMLRRKKTPA